MEVSNFSKLKKYLIRLGTHFILVLLGFVEIAFSGYGWRAFLARLLIVAISFILNPHDFAVHQSATAPMKLFLFTCAFLAYTILMLVLDYTKRGKEFEAKRREAKK